MALKKHIDNIRSELERRQFTNETAVRLGIIDPLLKELGWPTSKTQIVFPEYPVDGGKVDYALCHPPARPRIFIEAKQVGKLEGAEKQLFRYASHRGVRVAILTDGQKWSFFYPPGEGTYEERKVVELNFITGDSEKNANLLNRYLNIEDSVPSIRVPPAQDSKPKRPLQWTKLVVTMPDGEIVECSKIKDTFVAVIEKLGVEKVAALDIIRRKIPRVSASEYPGHSQRQSGSYYIYTGGSTKEKRHDLLKIAKGLGIELKVEILPKD